ncbi:MAG: division/cell wall cluster transcriptional repressor MraZ [Opitutaceae bacterium]
MALLKTGLFVGTHHHNLDDKGRLTIPAQWRPNVDSDDNSFLALPNPAGYVTVYPPKMIAQLEERISQISLGDTEGQQAVEALMSMAHSFSCDKQGRINLNEKLVKHAKIKKGAVLLGKLSTFSIYSEEIFKAIEATTPVEPEAQAAVFKRFGL